MSEATAQDNERARITTKVWITAQVDSDTRDAIKATAKRENRTVSAQIRQFIMEGLEQRQERER